MSDWHLDVLALRDATPLTSSPPVEEAEPVVEDVAAAVLQYVEPYEEAADASTVASVARIRRTSWREQSRCWWCNVILTRPVTTGTQSPDARTREHIMPSSFGGGDGDENVVAACYRCNTARGRDLTWVAYSEHKGDARDMSPSQKQVFKHFGYFKRKAQA